MESFVLDDAPTYETSQVIRLLTRRTEVSAVHAGKFTPIPMPIDGGLLIESKGIAIGAALYQLGTFDPSPVAVVALHDDAPSDSKEMFYESESPAMLNLRHCTPDDEGAAQVLRPIASAAMKALMMLCGADSVLTVMSKTNYKTLGDVSGLIGLHEEDECVLSVSFSRSAALGFASRTVGRPADDLQMKTVLGCIGELVSIVARQVRMRFYETDFGFDTATPCVISGNGHNILFRRELQAYGVQVESDIGPFSIKLCKRPH